MSKMVTQKHVRVELYLTINLVCALEVRYNKLLILLAVFMKA